jgi:hypothetical protein
MKSTLSQIFIFSIGLAFSCNQEEGNPYGFTGNGSAIKNTDKWQSGLRITPNKIMKVGVDLDFTVTNNDGVAIENLFLYKVKLISTKQSIKFNDISSANDSTGVYYSTLLSDGDVLGDIYELDTLASTNFLLLTNIDPNRKKIEGIFNIQLKIKRDDGIGPAPPSKIILSDGIFQSRMNPEWLK